MAPAGQSHLALPYPVRWATARKRLPHLCLAGDFEDARLLKDGVKLGVAHLFAVHLYDLIISGGLMSVFSAVVGMVLKQKDPPSA
jgi:hypothetical protein